MRHPLFHGLLLAALPVWLPANAAMLFDSGPSTPTVSILATTDEGFTCGINGCEQDYETYAMGASRFTLVNGGLVDSIAFAAVTGDGMEVEIYRGGPGKLVKTPANLVWRNGMAGQTSSVALGTTTLPRGQLADVYQITNSGLSIAMVPGIYWVTLWTAQPTFGHHLALMAGSGTTRNAISYGRTHVPAGWAYLTGPQAALQIAASNIYPGVPEPSSWALMVTGFGLVGGTLRRRRVQTAG